MWVPLYVLLRTGLYTRDPGSVQLCILSSSVMGSSFYIRFVNGCIYKDFEKG